MFKAQQLHATSPACVGGGGKGNGKGKAGSGDNGRETVPKGATGGRGTGATPGMVKGQTVLGTGTVVICGG